MPGDYFRSGSIERTYEGAGPVGDRRARQRNPIDGDFRLDDLEKITGRPALCWETSGRSGTLELVAQRAYSSAPIKCRDTYGL